MVFLESFCEFLGSTTPEKLKEELSLAQVNIWKSGLSEEEVHKCVQIFLETEYLSHDIRELMLQCLVPNEKIPVGTVNALLAWYFSNYSKNLEDAKSFLHWLSVMLANKLVNTQPVENLINQFLFCFYYSELIAPVCRVLRYVINSQSITARSVFIAKYFFQLPVKTKGKAYISFILRMMHSCSPSLLPNPPSGKNAIQETTDNFHKAVYQIAFKNGFVNTSLPNKKVTASLSMQSGGKKKSEIIYSTFADSEVLENLTGVKEMRHLGWMIKKKKISHLQSICSLVGCKAGQIYVSARTIVDGDFPSEDKYTIIPILGKLLETSQRIRNGIPIVTRILDGYLLSWNGEENKDIIYKILTWIHFDSFEELYTNVLCHLINLFFIGTKKDKICILDCLTQLITNKVTTVDRIISRKLIDLVGVVIRVALVADGFNSSALMLSCLRFYQCISYLEQRYMLGTWTIPPPFVVFGAFFSRNYVLVSEICELIVRHYVVMYPFFISLGIIQDFQDEEEVVKTYLRDLYLFLWKGQASKTELITSQEDDLPWFFNKDMDSLFSVKMHHGIYPLTAYVADKLALANPRHFNEKSLIKLLDRYANGILAVKSAYEN